MDASGEPTNDPTVFVHGLDTLLRTGGRDHGHKGCAMALLVETMTQGLSGYGRRDAPTGIAMNTLLQLLDPQAFGGRKAFTNETDWLVEACRSNPPVRVWTVCVCRAIRPRSADGRPSTRA